jgi:toxin YhaV
MLIVNGWTLLAHPLYLDQMETLAAAVERRRAKSPDDWQNSANAKLLTALRVLMFERIPADPSTPEYRQGNTLGPTRKHWFRAKFGGGRFRLFFRYSSTKRIIIYAWVNDQESLRTYGSKTDAYAVFYSMLNKGYPPDDWLALMNAASASAALTRLEQGAQENPSGNPHGAKRET